MLLEEMPQEILHHVIRFLDVEDLTQRLVTLSRFWKDLADDSFLWKSLCMKKWDINIDQLYESSEDDSENWKKYYWETHPWPKKIDTSRTYSAKIVTSQDCLSVRLKGAQCGGNQIVFGDYPFRRIPNKSKLKPFTVLEAFSNSLSNHDSSKRLSSIGYRVTTRFTAYYELTILPSEVSSSKMSGCVAIGLCPNDFSTTDLLPGWRRGSYGFHSDDGKKFGGDHGLGKSYSKPFGINDTVGCGINFRDNVIFFTRNGKFLGVAFLISDTLHEIWPVIGVDTLEIVSVNFGAQPFKYKFDPLPPRSGYFPSKILK